MSKEAMNLALEALEGLEALLLSMGLTHLIVYGDAEKAITNLQKELEDQTAQQALDKKAENARELGLDYEPAQRTWVGLTDADKQEAFDETQEASGGFWEFADYLEAKLKEKNQ